MGTYSLCNSTICAAYQPTMERHQPILLAKRLQDGALMNTQRLAGQKRKLEETRVIDSPTKTIRKETPVDFVERVFKKENGVSPVSVPFIKPTEEMIEAYKVETLTAARSENIEALRKLHIAGASLNCCNRFGESLIHLACRRGNLEMVKFLVKEAGVTLLLRDDYGRTVLHDAFWTPEPKFDLVEFLIEEMPEFLCVKDVRGHFPLNYVRKEHQEQWYSFLQERKALLRSKLSTR